MTHDIMDKHPIAGERFGNILQFSDEARSDDKRSHDWKSKRKHKKGSILRSDMIAGYTGKHINDNTFKQINFIFHTLENLKNNIYIERVGDSELWSKTLRGDNTHQIRQY